MAATHKLVPVTIFNEKDVVLNFNKKVAEAFGSMQIIAGSAFIALSLAAMYWGYTLASQMSTWFSIFWVLGGTTHIMAGYSKSVSVLRTTLLLGIISLISTVVYMTIIGYQVDRFDLTDRAIGIYTGMTAACFVEMVFAILTIVHCAKGICSTYPKSGQVGPTGGTSEPQNIPMVFVQQVDMAAGPPLF